jgi:type II secretory pathway component PulK
MVTLELALASLGAAAVLVLLAWVLTVVMLLVRCQDTATGIARQEARGDHAAAVKVASSGPDRARVSLRHDQDRIEVTVTLEARPWASWLPSVPLAAAATVIAEPA